MSAATEMRICSLSVLLALVAALALPPDALAQGQRRVSSSWLLIDTIGAGNPEVKIEATTLTVLEQAEALSASWAA